MWSICRAERGVGVETERRGEGEGEGREGTTDSARICTKAQDTKLKSDALIGAVERCIPSEHICIPYSIAALSREALVFRYMT